MIRIFDYVFAVFGMFYMSEGFASLLAAPTELADISDPGSPAIRNLGILIGLVSIIRLAGLREAAKQITVRSWLFWLPVVVAVASALWSGDPDLALRRSAALVLTTLFALYLASRFDARALVNALLIAMLLYCAGSLLLIVLAPSIGVHTAADTRFYEHVGAFRGLSPFKNDFGRIAAFAGTVFFVAAVTRPEWRKLYGVAAIAALGLVVGSRSGQAIFLCLVCAAVALYVVIIQRLSPRHRTALVVLTIPTVLFMTLAGPALVELTLEALGKDPTLTGRMNIWPEVLVAMRDNLVLGGGYGAGWNVLVNDHMRQVLGREIGHAHNGYLNLIVEIGIVGLFITLTFIVGVTYRTADFLMSSRNRELVVLTFTLLVFILVGNWVGSFLLKHNSIFWVLLVCVYCKLGEAWATSASAAPIAPSPPSKRGMAIGAPEMSRRS